MTKPSMHRRFRDCRAGQGAHLLTLLVLLGATPAAADPPIRCAERVVDVGMPDFEVRRLCGVPDGVTPFTVQRFVAIEPGGRGGVAAGTAVTVPGERWDYAARNGRLPRALLFEGGRLVRIDVGRY